MFEHLDDPGDITPAPLAQVIRRGNALRTRRRVVVATTSIAGVAMVATASAALASTGSGPNRVTAASPTTAPTTLATAHVTTTSAPTAVNTTMVTTTLPAPAPVASAHPTTPDPAAQPAPPAAAPTPADIGATASPMHTTVSAGTTVNVALHLTNSGGTAGRYIYAYDSCPRALVPPADQMCSQVVQTVTVQPGQSLDKTVPINTTGASSGQTYSVKFPTLTVTITIS